MRDRTARHLSTLHTFFYRATGGRIGRRLVDNDMLLLTTTGRTSGKDHTVPLLYLDAGHSLVVIASWGGRPNHPHWYLNLLRHPQATVQTPGRTFPVVARIASDEERRTWWPRILGAYAGYATYQSRTDREIPVVFLEEAGPGGAGTGL
jgi:deazaflavin-dependent oxidoreductase (nitroreductase family)